MLIFCEESKILKDKNLGNLAHNIVSLFHFTFLTAMIYFFSSSCVTFFDVVKACVVKREFKKADQLIKSAVHYAR